MFTGLIQAMGEVVDLRPSPVGVRLVIRPLDWDHLPSLGDSLSVSGVCLTLAQLKCGRAWGFDVVQQTLRLTTLGGLRPGSRINLEHSALPTTLLGGHIVQGHIDGLGEVHSVQTGEDWRIRIRPANPRFMDWVVPQGSIAVDGVSLTIAGTWKLARSEGFEIALIPTTLARTTLATLDRGDRVNLEADTIAKTVAHMLRRFQERAPRPETVGLSAKPAARSGVARRKSTQKKGRRA